MAELTVKLDAPVVDRALAMVTTAAVKDVLMERHRQVDEEGWTPEHDDEYDPGSLSLAGAAYAGHAALVLDGDDFHPEPPDWWVWDAKWWKPGSPRRDLVKAAALIIAEIERIDRATELQQIADDAEKMGDV